MSAQRVPAVAAIDTWRSRRVYRARIVNSDTAPVVVKSAKALKVGKRISFARVPNLEASARLDWRSGVIWRIEKGCLHLTRT